MKIDGLEFALEKTAGLFGFFGKSVAKQAPLPFGKPSFGKQLKDTVSMIGDKVNKPVAAILSTYAITRMVEKIRNDTTRKMVIESLMENDPVLKQEDPAVLLEYYATLCLFAPNVSKDKNTVRELLVSFVKFGRVDMATIKALVETESKIGKSDGKGLAAATTVGSNLFI